MRSRARCVSVIVEVLKRKLPPFDLDSEAINCHHNYVAQEEHFGENVFVPRKGAISARLGELENLPGEVVYVQASVVRKRDKRTLVTPYARNL